MNFKKVSLNLIEDRTVGKPRYIGKKILTKKIEGKITKARLV
jgi:hypothetical protein